MKFENAKEVHIEKKVSKKNFSKKVDFVYSRLNSWDIINNVSICIMKPEMKGQFEFLNQLINNGTAIMPWTIKITHINGFWTVYVGHNADNDPDISYRQLASKYEDKYDISNFKNYSTISKINDRIEVENIINNMINNLKHSESKVIESNDINVKYTCEVKYGQFSLPEDSLYNSGFDEGTYKKFLMMLDKLDKLNLKGEDKKIFHSIGLRLIRNKFIDKNDREQLNNLSGKYLEDKDRIKIAMKFL